MARSGNLLFLTPRLRACEPAAVVGEDGAADGVDFGRLVADHEQALLARARFRDPEHPRDLVHDTFVRAMAAMPRPLPTNVRAWLYRILDNLFIDQCRRRAARAGTQPFDDELGVPAPVPDEPPPWAALSGADVLAASAQLSDTLRPVFELHAFKKKKYREIAELLGIPENTVATRLARARERLKELLLARVAPDAGRAAAGRAGGGER